MLGRRRYEVSGHFGLRVTPGGIVTPAFGPEPEVLRIAEGRLIREVGGACSALEIDGASLEALAAFAHADLDAPFSVGDNTPPLGDVDRPVRLEPDAFDAIAGWFDLGSRVLDAVMADPLTAGAGGDDPATVQLWPEHFDMGTDVPLAGGRRTNLGFSAGDGFSAEPYAYVGPWDDAHPGGDYWNAPFGAALTRTAAGTAAHANCIAFMRQGLELLTTADTTTTTKGAS